MLRSMGWWWKDHPWSGGGGSQSGWVVMWTQGLSPHPGGVQAGSLPRTVSPHPPFTVRTGLFHCEANARREGQIFENYSHIFRIQIPACPL